MQNETTRILGRVVAREISAEEAASVSGGGGVELSQTWIQYYDKNTGLPTRGEAD